MLLKKIYFTTLLLFIILTIYSIPITSLKNKRVLRTNLEIQEVSIPSIKVFLRNEDNYLVQTEMILEGNSLEEKIKNIIDYLTIEKNHNLHGIIPKNTKLLNVIIESNKVILNFSKEILNQKEDNQMIAGIVHSLLALEIIEKVSFLVEDKEMKEWNKEYDKSISINPNYLYHSRENLSKVVIYYLDDTYKNYIPVTNYYNTKKEKIDIIIEELRNNPSNLISFIPNNLELLNYHEEENVLFLNFNEKLENPNNEVTNAILNEISYSVFDNYEVNMVMFEVNNKKYKYQMRQSNKKSK